MPKADRCIFCGRLELCEEDLIPRWLDKYYSSKKVGGKVLRVGTIAGKPQPQRRYDKMRVKVRAVCPTCNNGWMSRLEQQVQPILARMVFNGPPSRLRQDDQKLLAAWFTKYLMVMEWQVFTRPAFFTQDERSRFRDDQTPTAGMTIWIAPMRSNPGKPGTWVFRSVGHDLSLPPQGMDSPVIGIGYTLQLVFLVFQAAVVRGQLPKASDSRWESLTFQIWPIHPAQQWPPTRRLRDSQFRSFAHRWKKTEQAMKRPK
jgi:hypothetical protein